LKTPPTIDCHAELAFGVQVIAVVPPFVILEKNNLIHGLNENTPVPAAVHVLLSVSEIVTLVIVFVPPRHTAKTTSPAETVRELDVVEATGDDEVSGA